MPGVTCAVAVSGGMVVTSMKGYCDLFDEERMQSVKLPKSSYMGETRRRWVHVSVPASALTNEVVSDRRDD